jgi:aspartyl-tRNA(Asn)/glutamyl-tRNA(Gln) amidotransferase subunit B
VQVEKYEVIIGLEVHAQLLTQTKLFCGCPMVFGAPANSQVCPVCAGLPGVLPVLNRRAVEFALKIALATGSEVAPTCRFARKNYFYPDLPKGYQISQYELPLCQNGRVTIETDHGPKHIGLIRIHLEEDAGKSIHDDLAAARETKLDFNRCGTPLVEIVSQPDMDSAAQAHQFLTRVRQLVRYLGICDGNMEEGSLRCDANINIRYQDGAAWRKTPISEIKNLNSFRHVQHAIDAGVRRQIFQVESGVKMSKESLLWNAARNELAPMRSKEEAHDYRYFPEPDLVTLRVDPRWLEEARRGLPELPQTREARFVSQYGLPLHTAQVLTADRDLADYFETCVQICPAVQKVANWITTEVMGVLNDSNISINEFSKKMQPQRIGRLLIAVEKNIITNNIAKMLFKEILFGPLDGEDALSLDDMIRSRGLEQIGDESTLTNIIDDILSKSPQVVADYRAGKTKLLGFFVGQIMKQTNGKANPQMVNQILKQKLSS